MATKKIIKQADKKPVEKNNGWFNQLRKKTLIFFAAVVVFVIVDMLVKNMVVKGISEFLYFSFAIVTVVYSIKLIKKKDYKVGLPLLVICSLVILAILLMFLVGLMIGVMMNMQSGVPPVY